MPPTAARPLAAYTPSAPNPSPTRAARLRRRVGIAAFLFFFIKGLAWLFVPAAVAVFAAR